MSIAPAVPHYQRVADTLKARISNGLYRRGEHLPAASELEKIFSVSNITIRKSLELLAREGWVAGKRGVGTIVMQPPAGEVVDIRLSGNFTEWFETASAAAHHFGQEVLDSGFCRPPERVGRLLGAGPDEEVWRLRRVRTMGAGPISHHINYAARETAAAIAEADLTGAFSFIEVLKRRSPTPLARADQHVEARVADIDIAALLGTDFGAPIFFVETLYRTADGGVAAVTHLYLRGDRYCYSASIPIDGPIDTMTNGAAAPPGARP